MNFNWRNDIYKDDYPKESENKKKYVPEFQFPWFFKIIGLLISFGTLTYSLSEMYWPERFEHSPRLPNYIVYILVLGGLVIEAKSKSDYEDAETADMRSIVVGIMLIIVVMFNLTTIFHEAFK